MRNANYSKKLLSANASSKLDILGHDRNALGVDRAQVRVFEDPDQVGFGSFLQSTEGRALEAQIDLECLGDLAYESLEGQLGNEELGALLVAMDVAKY